jgi:hypothetical protein
LVSTSAPADPRRLTRQTFRLARLPIPEPFATPLAELTTRVYLRPRGHAMGELSASRAVARYGGPLLLVHGALDSVVPPVHLTRLEHAALRGGAARRAAGEPAGGPVETALIPDGQHSWLYELPAYRRTVARFLADALDGPYPADDAAERAAAVDTSRVPEPEESFAAIALRPGPRRTIAELIGSAEPVPVGLQEDE